MRVPIMFPEGRFRLHDSSTDVDSSGITMLPSYSMYLVERKAGKNQRQTNECIVNNR